MTLMRQRSPSTLSFHPDESGMDDLDVILLKNINLNPGTSISELAGRILFYNREDPSDECRPNYWQIHYRITTLEKEGLIVTRREPSNKAMERRCFPR